MMGADAETSCETICGASPEPSDSSGPKPAFSAAWVPAGAPVCEPPVVSRAVGMDAAADRVVVVLQQELGAMRQAVLQNLLAREARLLGALRQELARGYGDPRPGTSPREACHPSLPCQPLPSPCDQVLKPQEEVGQAPPFAVPPEGQLRTSTQDASLGPRVCFSETISKDHREPGSLHLSPVGEDSGRSRPRPPEIGLESEQVSPKDREGRGQYSHRLRRLFSRERRGMVTQLHKFDDARRGQVSKTHSRARHLQRNLGERIVQSPLFEAAIAVFILLDSLSIGIQAEWGAAQPQLRQDDVAATLSFRTIDLFFTSVFTLEIGVRILARGRGFVFTPEWRWNIFDSLIVAMSLVQQAATMLVGSTHASSRTLRIVRILRYVRIIRITRVFRFFLELRLMVTMVLSCLKSLCWSVLLLMLEIWCVAIFFVQAASDYVRDHDDQRWSALNEDLNTYFGSLWEAIYTLFRSISGGIDWGDPALALRQIHELYGIVYMVFVAFTLFAVLNVVTGTFVEHARLVASHDLDAVVQSQAKRKDSYLRDVSMMFHEADPNHSGFITEQEFFQYLDDDRVQAFFSSLELGETTEAIRELFKLLDLNDSGAISHDEFTLGCLRIKGVARNLDLMRMISDHQRLANKMDRFVADTREQFKTIRRAVSIEIDADHPDKEANGP